MTSEYVTIATCTDNTERILAKLDSIDQRLFRDNGTLSIQTRLDRHEQVIRVLLWALSVIGGAFLLSAVSLVVMLIRHVLNTGGTP